MLQRRQIKFLRKKLHQVFEPVVLLRGERLFQQNAVLEAKYAKDQVIAHVKGTFIYTVVINLNGHYFSTECTCPYPYNCKHAAALCYHLIDSKHSNYYLDEVKKTSPAKPNLKLLEYGPVDEFKTIPVPTDRTLEEVIKFLSPKSITTLTESIQMELRANNMVMVRLATYTSYDDEIIKVDFKRTKSEFQICCRVCKIKSQKLCVHQAIVLKVPKIWNVINEFYLRSFDYDKVADSFCSRKKISHETLTKYFSIVLDEQSAWLQPLDNELYLGNNPKLNWLLEVTKNDAREKIKHEIYQLEESRRRINVMVWNITENINLIKASHHKRKPGELVHIERTDQPDYFSEEHRSLYNQLDYLIENNGSGEVIRFLQKNLRDLRMIKHFWTSNSLDYYYQRVKKSEVSTLEFGEGLATLHCIETTEEDIHVLTMKVAVGADLYPLSKIENYNPYFILIDGKAYIFSHHLNYDLLELFQEHDTIKFLDSDIEVKNKLLFKIQEIGEVTNASWDNYALKDGERQIHLIEEDIYLIFEPTILYDDCRINLFNPVNIIEPDLGKKYLLDVESLENYRKLLTSLHPNWSESEFADNYLLLSIDDFLENHWFIEFFEKIKAENIKIFGQEKLSNFRYNQNRPQINIQVSSGIDWFDTQVDITFGSQSAEQRQWIQAIKKNTKFVQLKDGTIGILPDEWVQQLNRIVKSSNKIDKNGLKISKFKFNIIDDLFEDIDDEIREEINVKREALKTYDHEKKYQVPESLNKILRPYQIEGYQWLKFLDEFSFGGCLADDMGLGKTVQVLCFLLEQKQHHQEKNLVIVPRTLLFNWGEEIEKFTPELSYLIHHGPNRKKQLNYDSEYDLMISTYDTVTVDIESFIQYKYNYIILDESQAIKNPNSQRYKAMRLLKSRNKLVMTGTPIENSTFDLFAQLSFVNPGMFGSLKQFKDSFATPIDKQGNEAVKEMLKKLIHPFLLRRTKELVISELPAKTETVILCEMDTVQRKMYDTLKNQLRKQLMKDMSELEDHQVKFQVLEALLKLRQICNSTELVNSTLPENQKTSIKIETLMAIIEEELVDHKALIFSQFVTMLSLVRKELDKRNISYAYIDGSTRKRKEAVKKFKNDPDCKLFLISIKAGNTGLNLTEADYVYILDPWWNPAVETQAIDRTHRIGQDKKVFAYKMICRDTIEEKIVSLQNRKKILVSELIQTDNNVFKSLKKEELLALFD